MSFQRNFIMLYRQSKNYKNNKSSLSSNFYKYSLSATRNAIHSSFFGRIASCALRPITGSLTLETTLVLPIFIFLCISMIFFSQIFMIHSEIQGGIFRAARELAGNVLLTQSDLDNNVGVVFSDDVICMVMAREKVIEYSGDVLNECICLEDGTDGLKFFHSSVTDEYVDIVVHYRVKLPYAFGLDASFPIVQRCRMRTWTGVSGQIQEEDEGLVYITETGNVYHESTECTHIKLKIQLISGLELAAARNNGGSKYKPCDKCAKNGLEGNKAYITREGDKYHNSLSCSGLKRSVRQIPKSQISEKSACTRCCR